MPAIVIKSINGVQPAAQPLIKDGYSIITSDLLSSGSGRSAETGITMRYKTRGNVYKLQLKFKGEVDKVASVLAQIRAFTLTVEFYDPAVTGGYVTADFYSGDPTFVPNGEMAELSVNLIEI